MFTVKKGSQPTKEIIEAAIAWNEGNRNSYDRLQDYYLGTHSILSRKKPELAANNRIVVNHAKYITDVNVGYLLGAPVVYQAEDGVKIDSVLEQYKKQSISNIDSAIAKDISKFGLAYEYSYAVGNDIHTKRVDVRNCVVVYDDTMEHEKLFAIIYSLKTPTRNEKNKHDYDVTWVIDQKNIYEYDEDLKLTNITEHAFNAVPVIEHSNNEDQMGDYEGVLSLIDAYNILQSDRVNDKEQLVEAILMFYGFELTTKQMEDVKKYRALSAPMNTKAEYLLKQLDEANLDQLRTVIEADIHKISMTPNLSDENFVGNSSGVAIRYKLIAFEQNIVNKERAFEVGLKQRFALYANYLNILDRQEKIEPYQINAIFTRNLPQNDFETSQMINNLMGTVSKSTLISQLSFIDDPEQELEKLDKETLENANLESQNFGTTQPNDDEEDSVEDLTKKVAAKITNE